MKVLWVGDTPNVSTGFARCTRVVCQELYQRGHEVAVLGINEYGGPHEYPYDIYPCISPFDGCNNFMGVDRLPILVDRLKPDIVVLLQDPWNVRSYFDALDATKSQCGEMDIEFDIPPMVAWLAVDSRNQKGEELNRLSHVVTWTHFAGKELISGGYGGGYSIIPLGVDTNLFYPRDKKQSREMVASKLPDDAFIVGMVGRNQPRKRIDLAIEIFAEWIHRCEIDDAYLYIYTAPTGERGCDIRQLVKYYGLTGRVILNEPHVGKGNSEDILPYVYSSFDVLLNTSLGEGFALPVLEAMACGVVTIVPDCGGLGHDGWTEDVAIQVECSGSALTAPLNGRPYTIGGVMDKIKCIEALNDVYQFEYEHADRIDRGLDLAKKLSWQSTANEFCNIMESIVGVCQFPDCNNPALCQSGNYGNKLVCKDHFAVTNGVVAVDGVHACQVQA